MLRQDHRRQVQHRQTDAGGSIMASEMAAVDVEQSDWCRRFGSCGLEDVQRTEALIWRLWLEDLDRATEHLRHRLDLDVSSMAPVFSHCTEAFVDFLSWNEVLDVFLIVFLSREQQGEMQGFFLNNGNQKQQHRAAR